MRATPLLALFLPIITHAQHCGYDFAAIIVVHPHVEGDTAVIKGLRITLLDSTNLPVTHYGRPYQMFLSNADPDACRHGTHGQRRCFPFAHDNYVLVIPRGLRTESMRVLVQDDDPGHFVDRRQERWQDGYAQLVMPLTAFDSYPLCGTYNDAVYPQLEDRPQYHPVDIILHRR